MITSGSSLISLLGLAACRFEYGSLLGHPPRLEPDGTVLAGHIRWDVEQFGLPGEELELRTFGNGQYFVDRCRRYRPAAGTALADHL